MMANYAVGDIQGCFEEFKEGLELIKFKSSKDFLWITGDLINRGPDSFKVLEYVFKNKNSVHIVLGNHDLHYLNCFFNNRNLSDEDTFQSQMFHKKSSKMAKFLLQQPFVFSKKILTKRKAIQVAMVHAGIPRNMSLKKAETFSKLCELKLINDPKKNLKKIFENKKNFHSINSFSGLVNFFTKASQTSCSDKAHKAACAKQAIVDLEALLATPIGECPGLHHRHIDIRGVREQTDQTDRKPPGAGRYIALIKGCPENTPYSIGEERYQ